MTRRGYHQSICSACGAGDRYEIGCLTDQLCRRCLPTAAAATIERLSGDGADIHADFDTEVMVDRRGRLHLDPSCLRRSTPVLLPLTELLTATWCRCASWLSTHPAQIVLHAIAAYQTLDAERAGTPHPTWDRVGHTVRRSQMPHLPARDPVLAGLFARAHEADITRARRSADILDPSDLYRSVVLAAPLHATHPADRPADDLGDIGQWIATRRRLLRAPQPRLHEPAAFAALDRWLDTRITAGTAQLVLRNPDRIAGVPEAGLLAWAFGEPLTTDTVVCTVPRPVARAVVAMLGRSPGRPACAGTAPRSFDRERLSVAAQIWADGGPVFSAFSACLAAALLL